MSMSAEGEIELLDKDGQPRAKNFKTLLCDAEAAEHLPIFKGGLLEEADPTKITLQALVDDVGTVDLKIEEYKTVMSQIVLYGLENESITLTTGWGWEVGEAKLEEIAVRGPTGMYLSPGALVLDITLVHPGLPTGAVSVTDLALAAKVKRPEALQIVGIEVNPGDESDWENVPVYWRGDAIKELGDKTLVTHPHIGGTQGRTGTCKTRTPPVPLHPLR